MHELAREEAAVQIQALHRGHASRRKLDERLKIKKMQKAGARKGSAGAHIELHTAVKMASMTPEAAARRIQRVVRGRIARTKHRAMVEGMDQETKAARLAASHKGQQKRKRLNQRLAEKKERKRLEAEAEAANLEEIVAVFRGAGAFGLGLKDMQGEIRVVSALSNSLRELYGGCELKINPPPPPPPSTGSSPRPNRFKGLVVQQQMARTEIPCPCTLITIVCANDGGRPIEVGAARGGLDHNGVVEKLKSAQRPVKMVFHVKKPPKPKPLRASGGWLADVRKQVEEDEARAAKEAEEAALAAQAAADKWEGPAIKVRKHSQVFWPLAYGFVFGFGALFMIYGIAAGLGPERTKQWLAAAFISLVLKVFFMDPMKVAAMACFVQYAEGLDSEIMQRLADVARNVDAN